MKKCNHCGEQKSLDSFYRQPNTRDGRRYNCRECAVKEAAFYRAKNRPISRAKGRAYYHANTERYRNTFLLNRYGITLSMYREMFQKQNGRCAICGKREIVVSKKTGKPRDLCVDHCHKTGKIRGLLCTHCNSGLGMIKDDPELAKKLGVYLLFHGQTNS